MEDFELVDPSPSSSDSEGDRNKKMQGEGAKKKTKDKKKKTKKEKEPLPKREGNRYLISLDVGTTGVRAFIYDDKAQVVGGSYRPLTTLYPQPGWVEQDPTAIWEQSVLVIREALVDARLDANQIAGAGITTQRSSFCLWNKETGETLCNFISWQDLRGVSIAKEVNESYVFSGIHAASKLAHLVTRSKKMYIASFFEVSPLHVTPRLAWALKNLEVSELLKEEKLLFGTVDTWLLWKLTGGKVHATDYSNAGATGLLDTFTLEWNGLLKSILSIPDSIFPELRCTSGDFGKTTKKLFGASIPITAVSADQSAALFGECCFDVGDTKITMGTGCFIDVNTGHEVHVSKHALHPLVAWKIGDKCTYSVEAVVCPIGTVIDWASKEMGLFAQPQESETMANSVPHSNGVLFVPSFCGLDTPHADPTARGTILGLGTDTKKEHIVRALLESVGYRCRECLETIDEDFPEIDITTPVKIDGGVSQNDFVAKFIADISGKEIVRVKKPSYVTALGAAYFAGLGAGIWESVEEIKQLQQFDKTFTPELDEDESDNLFNTWKRAIQRAAKWVAET